MFQFNGHCPLTNSVKGAYKCSKCGQAKKGHKCPQGGTDMGVGGGTADMYDMSYSYPQMSHLLKTIAHLENSVKVSTVPNHPAYSSQLLQQQNLQLRDLLSKYEANATVGQSTQYDPNTSTGGSYGIDYTSQYEAYQRVANVQAANMLQGIDYASLTGASSGLLGQDQALTYQQQQQLQQVQLQNYARVAGPSFEVDERYQISHDTPTYTASAYNSMPVGLDSGMWSHSSLQIGKSGFGVSMYYGTDSMCVVV